MAMVRDKKRPTCTSGRMMKLGPISRDAYEKFIEELPNIIARQDSPHYEMIWQGATPKHKSLLIGLSPDATANLFPRVFKCGIN